MYVRTDLLLYQSQLWDLNFSRSRNGDLQSVENINPYVVLRTRMGKIQLILHRHGQKLSYYYVVSVRTYIINESASRNLTPRISENNC